MTTRTYTGVEKEEILNAAQKVFEHVDSDFRFQYPDDDSLIATRNWSAFLLVAMANGSDTWHIKTLPSDNRVIVNVNFNQSEGGSFVNTGAPGALVPTARQVNDGDGNAIYNLFFARLEYFLNKRSEWMNCDESNTRITKGIDTGRNSAFCNTFNVDDINPTK